jgi:hypothetical protein
VIPRVLVAILLSLGLSLPPVPASAGEPPVWAVAGRSNIVYLFGSVHLLKPGDFAIGGELEAAYEDAEAVFLEVDMDDLSPLDVAATTAARAIDPAGRNLDELMGPEAATARDRAAESGIDLSLLAGMEPWFAGLAVITLSLAKEGYTAGAGVEQLVQERALTDGKEILGFETIDEQLAALDSMELELQREFLLKALEDAARPDESLVEFLEAWKSGDDAALAEELKSEFDSSPELYQSLMVQRNRLWIEQIDDLLDDDRDYLVVVGALHLVGPDGLPAQLASRGLNVDRR